MRNRRFIAISAALAVVVIIIAAAAAVYFLTKEKPTPPQVLTAVRVDRAPDPAALGKDEVWAKAPATTVTIDNGPEVILKAVYTDENIYVLGKYPDSTKDLVGIIEYDGKEWKPGRGNDIFAMFFNINNSIKDFNTKGLDALNLAKEPGCQSFTLTLKMPSKLTKEALNQRGDLWQVGGLTTQYGRAFDQFLGASPYMIASVDTRLGAPEIAQTTLTFDQIERTFLTRPFGPNRAGGRSADATPKYIYKEGYDIDNTPFPTLEQMQELTDSSQVTKGYQLPHELVTPGETYGGSFDDIDGNYEWSNKDWNLLFGRKLNTGHADDIKLSSDKKGAKYYFAILLRTNGDKFVHSAPMVLEFKGAANKK